MAAAPPQTPAPVRPTALALDGDAEIAPGPVIHFSVIVPAYNEEHYLPRLLASIERARQRAPGGPASVEVIVADNVSTDATAAVAAAYGCRVVRVETRCIAAVRNGGARAARGEVLCFIDADSAMHVDTFAGLAESMRVGRCGCGATGIFMERWSLGIATAWALMIPWVWLAGIDTGVVFCRRADFDAVGGYDESMQFAEDIHFYMRIKRFVGKRGERFGRLGAWKALGSTRKFDLHGDWHYARMIVTLPWLLLRRGAAAGFAKRYWYMDGRGGRPRLR